MTNKIIIRLKKNYDDNFLKILKRQYIKSI
jgi:hypothetical protein